MPALVAGMTVERHSVSTSWPDLFRPSTSSSLARLQRRGCPRHRRAKHAVLWTAMRGHDSREAQRFNVMAGTSPAMTMHLLLRGKEILQLIKSATLTSHRVRES